MYALGNVVTFDEPYTGAEIQPYPTPSQTETLFRTEVGIVGPTPIVTSQSPPPPPTPVYPPSYSQSVPFAVPLPIMLAALAIGGLLLFFLVRGIRA